MCSIQRALSVTAHVFSFLLHLQHTTARPFVRIGPETDDIGCLAAGMAADCFLISLDRIELAGAQFDPLSLLGTVGLKGPVDYTIVNGVAVVQNGELVTADEGELAARANAAVCHYLGRC